MGALNPLAAGVALKRAIWSAQGRVELFCCFFIKLPFELHALTAIQFREEPGIIFTRRFEQQARFG
jgi:hypothetical protein